MRLRDDWSQTVVRRECGLGTPEESIGVKSFGAPRGQGIKPTRGGHLSKSHVFVLPSNTLRMLGGKSRSRALWGRAEELLGIRELSYACRLWDAAEECLESRKLLYVLSLTEELPRSRELSSTLLPSNERRMLGSDRRITETWVLALGPSS
jgi:hypothetical protein